MRPREIRSGFGQQDLLAGLLQAAPVAYPCKSPGQFTAVFSGQAGGLQRLHGFGGGYGTDPGLVRVRRQLRDLLAGLELGRRIGAKLI